MFGKGHSRSPPGQSSTCRRISLRGFTLIELMVAIAILAILTVIAAPSMSRIIARYRLTSTADEVITLMRYGQSEAKGRGKSVTLSISDNELTIKDESEVLRHIDVSSRLILKPSPSLQSGGVTFLTNGQIRPANNASGRLSKDDTSRGMLLLCSSSLAVDQNAIAIRFSGAELRRQERSGGADCSETPPNSD